MPRTSSRSRSRSVRSERRSRARSGSPGDEKVGYQGGEKSGPNLTIFVAALADNVKERDLERLFKDQGFVVKDAQIPRDRMTQRHRGFAFVELDDPTGVEDACRKLNGFEFFGRQLKCEPRQPRGEDNRKGRGRGGFGGRRRDSRARGRDSRPRGGRKDSRGRRGARDASRGRGGSRGRR